MHWGTQEGGYWRRTFDYDSKIKEKGKLTKGRTSSNKLMERPELEWGQSTKISCSLFTYYKRFKCGNGKRIRNNDFPFAISWDKILQWITWSEIRTSRRKEEKLKHTTVKKQNTANWLIKNGHHSRYDLIRRLTR